MHILQTDKQTDSYIYLEVDSRSSYVWGLSCDLLVHANSVIVCFLYLAAIISCYLIFLFRVPIGLLTPVHKKNHSECAKEN